MWYHVNCLKLSVTKLVFELERKGFRTQVDCMNSDPLLLLSNTKIGTINMGMHVVLNGIQMWHTDVCEALAVAYYGCELLVPFCLFGVLIPWQRLGYQRTCRTYSVHSAFDRGYLLPNPVVRVTPTLHMITYLSIGTDTPYYLRLFNTCTWICDMSSVSFLVTGLLKAQLDAYQHESIHYEYMQQAERIVERVTWTSEPGCFR